jgi:hypothetical protein
MRDVRLQNPAVVTGGHTHSRELSDGNQGSASPTRTRSLSPTPPSSSLALVGCSRCPRLPTHQPSGLLFAAVFLRTNSAVNFVNWDAKVFASRTAIASRLSVAVTERKSASADGATAV